jgi:PDDEXK-like uncharacterized protein DUF3799
VKITEPGVYDLPNGVYHSDCCDGPSLSSTGARLLATQCPAAYKWSKENPPVKEEFEIGNATHLLVLEPHLFEESVLRIPLPDYRTKEARDLRDEARATGLLPLTTKHQEQVDGMRASLFADPIAHFALSNGIEVERSMFARDPEFDTHWVKCRPDIMPHTHRYLADVKTTTDADPSAFANAIVNYGYHQQAAWYRWVVDLVLGYRAADFYFLVVSKSPPHLVTTIKLDDEAIGWGDILNRYARGVFAWCLERDSWPSFTPDITQPPAAFTVGLPFWAKRELERRHEAGEFTPPQERFGHMAMEEIA